MEEGGFEDMYGPVNQTVAGFEDMYGNTNQTFDENDSLQATMQHQLLTLQYWMSGVMTTLVVVLGLVGNILTIVILSQRAMRSSTNYYLTALAVWDIVVLICTFLLIGLNGIKVEPYVNHFHSYVVAYIYPVALIAQTATIWLTVSFTVERYIAVCHPLRAASMCTISRAKIVIMGVSLGSSLYNIPRWFEYEPVTQVHPEYNETVLGLGRTEFSQNPLYLMGYFSCLYVPIMFIIPFLVLFILNAFLIRAVRQSQRNREMHMNVRQSRENNVTIMLVSVVIVFMICQLPALVYNLAYSVDISMVESSYGYHILSEIRNFMVNLNSAVNFILYCALGQKFRRIFLHTFCRRCLHESYIPMSGVHHHHHHTTIVSIPSQRQHRFSVNNRAPKFGHRTEPETITTKTNSYGSGNHGNKVPARTSQESNCDYHPVNHANNTEKWNRHQRAIDMFNEENPDRKYDYAIDQLLPERNQNSFPMYKIGVNNGTRLPA